MALKNLQEPRNIKITQCKHEVSHFHLNYFLHVAFTAIFEAFPYIVLQTAKIVPAPTCVVWSWRLKGCSAPASAVRGSLCRAFSPISARRLRHADEGGMAVRMRKVLARPWVGVGVCHLLLLLFLNRDAIVNRLMSRIYHIQRLGCLCHHMCGLNTLKPR